MLLHRWTHLAEPSEGRVRAEILFTLSGPGQVVERLPTERLQSALA